MSRISFFIVFIFQFVSTFTVAQTPPKAYFDSICPSKNYALAVEPLLKAAQEGNSTAQCWLGFMYSACQGVKQDRYEAAKWLRKAAEQGNIDAQYAIGHSYMEALGIIEYDEEAKWCAQAFPFIKAGAESGDAIKQYQLAKMYVYGKVSRNEIEGHKWFSKAFSELKEMAETGDIVLQKEVGDMYYFGSGVTKNKTEAAKWYLKSANAGFAPAQYSLAGMHADTYSDYEFKNIEEGLMWYHKAAVQGHLNAMDNIGYAYSYGFGVPKSETEALVWYAKGAEHDALKQFNMAMMYYEGSDWMTKNLTEAFKWMYKSAMQGDIDAQFNLGHLYYKGEGVPINKTEAFKWYLKVAEQGSNTAQNYVGYMYYQGEGVSLNQAEAFKWYEKAAKQGNQFAQYNLAEMYNKGEVVGKDEKEAQILYESAAREGHIEAKAKLQQLKEKAIIAQNMNNAEPLGLKIGVSKYSAIAEFDREMTLMMSWNELIESKGNVKSIEGLRYKSSGKVYGMEGLNNITYIFTEDSRLDFVMIDMNKNNFDKVNSYLQSKYSLQEQSIPSVGDKYAKYTQGNSLISIHLSQQMPNMVVIYKTKDFDVKVELKKAELEQIQKSKF